jgi:hypothetical protein
LAAHVENHLTHIAAKFRRSERKFIGDPAVAEEAVANALRRFELSQRRAR